MKPKTDNLMERFQSWVSNKTAQKLSSFSKMYKLPISRLIAIAIDNELMSDTPFKTDLDYKNYDGGVEYAYAHEAGKITTYMKRLRNPASLDLLYVMRNDMGIEDPSRFLGGFNECIKQGILEISVAPSSVKYRDDLGEQIVYRLKTQTPEAMKKVRSKVSQHAQYLKLKEKFEGKEK